MPSLARPPIVICTALLAISLQSVTINLKPMRLSEALPILAKATNLKLTAAGALQEEVVFAHANAVDSKPLLDHLATALYAKWELKEDGTRQLVIDSDARSHLKTKETQDSRETLVKSLEYIADRLSKQPDKLDAAFIREYRDRKAKDDARRKAAEQAEDWAQVFVSTDVLEETPAWRAAGRIAPLLGTDKLLSMPHEAKEVWSERPTAVQRSMPAAARQILSNYRRELSLLSPELQVDRVLMTAKRWEAGGAFNMQLKAYEASGRVVDQGLLRLNNDGGLMKVPYNQRNKFNAQPGEQPVTVPQEAMDARTVLAADGDRSLKSRLLPIWRPAILDPITHEPTQWHLGSDLIQAAIQSNRNIVGTLSDFTGARFWQSTKDTPSQIFARTASHVKQLPDGWIVAFPNGPINRISRAKAMALLTSCNATGGLSVDAAAKWIAGTTDRFPSVTWVGDYMDVLLPSMGRYSATATLGNEYALKLWNTLSPATLRTLRGGQTINLANLSSAAKSHIHKLVYWWDTIESGQEPTDQFPNGIDSGTMKLTVSERPLLIAWNATQGKPTNPMPLDEKALGNGLARGNTYFEVSAETYQSYNRYIIGVHRTYLFDLTINPGAVPLQLEVGETFFDPKAPTVDQLPAAIAGEVEKARQAALAKPVAPPIINQPPPLSVNHINQIQRSAVKTS